MLAIVCLSILLMMDSWSLQDSDPRKTGKGGESRQLNIDSVGKWKNCSARKIVTNQLLKWKKSDKWKFYIPNSSCYLCHKPQCIEICTSMQYAKKFKMYTNLFEFGLFAYNMADKNYFNFRLNKGCYITVGLTKTKKNKDIIIRFYECDSKTVSEEGICSKEVHMETKKDVDMEMGCIFGAMAFIEKQKIHWAFTSDCTILPSLTVFNTTPIKLSSKKCNVDLNVTDDEREEQEIFFSYVEETYMLVDGITFVVPCYSNGMILVKETGALPSGEKCKSFVRNETHMQGLDYAVNHLYINAKHQRFEEKDYYAGNLGFSLGEGDKEVLNFEAAHKPTYVGEDQEYLPLAIVKQMYEEIPKEDIKVYNNCNLVKPGKGTKPSQNTPAVQAVVPTAPPAAQVKPMATTKPPAATAGSGTGLDSARGNRDFLSTEMKIIILVFDLTILFFLFFN